MVQLYERYVLCVLQKFDSSVVGLFDRFNIEVIIELAVERALDQAVHAHLRSSSIRGQGPVGRHWFFSEMITTNMHGSGEQHQAWILRRLKQSEESP